MLSNPVFRQSRSAEHPARMPRDDHLDRLRDEELLRRYAATRDPRLRDQLFERWMPLTRQLARRYARTQEPFEDLLQVASIGLLKALQGYDPDRGKAFSSYAVPTIMGELKRYFRDRTWAVRMPRSLQELAIRVEDARERMAGELGRSPSVTELAAAAGASQEEVLEALQAGHAYRARSLDAHRTDEDDDGASLGDALGGVDHGFRLAEHRALLGTVLPELDEREREILRMRFEDDLTQHEIAAVVGVSQMQISRLIRRSLHALREAAERSPVAA
jgi:RNA polymerase sigma-B factor